MQKSLFKIIGTLLNLLVKVSRKKAGALGFKLFCYPVRSKLNDRQLEFLTEAKVFQVLCGKERIQVYKWGTGPDTILFLHGWQSHSYRWKKYIDMLDPNRFTIYAMDAPAHGLSTGKFMSVPFYSEAIAKVLDKIGAVNAIVGHSVGGFTALYTLFERPELMPRNLLIMATPGNAEEFIDLFRQTLGLSQQAVDATIERFVNYAGKRPEYFSAVTFAKDIRCPGLIIHDEGDREALVGNARAIHAAWPNSELVITEGLGHNLRSNVVVDIVVQYLNRVRPPAKIN